MAASARFLDFITELLAPLGPVTTKPMFGVVSLYASGLLFGFVENGALYLKADAATKVRFESEGLKPYTFEGKTRPVAMSYWPVPERLYDEPDELLLWAREAVGVAASTKAKTQRRARVPATAAKPSKKAAVPKRKPPKR